MAPFLRYWRRYQEKGLCVKTHFICGKAKKCCKYYLWCYLCTTYLSVGNEIIYSTICFYFLSFLAV